MKSKLAFFIFQTANRSNGGVKSLVNIIRQSDSIEPYILTNRRGPFVSEWESYAWPVKSMGIDWGLEGLRKSRMARRIGGIFDLIKSNVLVWLFLLRRGIKVLYCNDVQSFWCAYFGGRAAGAKVIFNLRDTKSAAEMGDLGKWSFIMRQADRLVVLSAEMKAFVELHLLPKGHTKPIDVTYSIVDLERFAPAQAAEKVGLRQKLGLGQADFVVLYVAAFNEKKAQIPFIEQVVAHFSARPSVKFYFIGDFDVATNPYAKACQDLVAAKGLGATLRFVGFADNIAEWYKASDLVAIASQKEGLARCMIEAMSVGVPVVSFDVCSAREMLEGRDCGLVAEQGDYAAYITAIERILADAPLRARFATNGHRAAQALFAKHKVMAAYQAVYES